MQVCDDLWDLVDAAVVCRELGWVGPLRATNRSEFGPVSGRYTMDNVKCVGSEASLADCPHEKVDNCHSMEAAGVVCDTTGEKAAVPQYPTTQPQPSTPSPGRPLHPGLAALLAAAVAGLVCLVAWLVRRARAPPAGPPQPRLLFINPTARSAASHSQQAAAE